MAINPLAIGGGVVAAAAVVGGGLYAGGVFTSSSNGDKTPTPEAVKEIARSIKDEKEENTYSDGNLGKKYAYYFLSTKDNVNKETWAKKAELIKSTLANDTFFTDVASKQGKEKITELKKKCKEKYGVNEGTDKVDAWKEVWKFCSLFGTKPTTIEEATDAVSKITGENKEKEYSKNENTKLGKTHKAKLISTYDPANSEFWKIRDKEFKAGGLAGSGTASTYFSTSNTTKPDILTLCRDAYEQTSAAGDSNETTTAPTQNNLFKYCTLTGQ